jgi:uncharacterized repeat protein (TIGR01451 family)
MSTGRISNPSQRKTRQLRLSIAILILMSSSMLVGVWAKRSVSVLVKSSINASRTAVQNQTPTPTPKSANRSAKPWPDSLPHSSPGVFAPELASGTQVYINFDNVPSGTVITNQYPPAIFSTSFGYYTFANGLYYYGSSYPNCLDRGPLSSPGSGYAPLYVDFTTPVNNLRFYLLAVDELRNGIAQLNIYQSGTMTASRSIPGFGNSFNPILIDVGDPTSSGGMGYSNVTRVEVVNITDYLGIAFDDFSFTIAPTPAPTPTPQPIPATPTGLSATVTDQQVRLSWTGSAAASGYYVKRATASGLYTTIAALQDPSYLDSSTIGDTTYFYVVSAFNSGGESPNSNQVSVSIPSACGDQPGMTQSPGHIHSISGWDMTVEVSPNDGVVLKDVSLNGRYMARSISIPYFTFATSKTQGVVRAELKPNSADSTLRSRLVKLETDAGSFDAAFAGGGIAIDAEYVIDRITGTSNNCLHVTQHYTFLGNQLTKLFNGGRPCEPSGTVPCEMYSPLVYYRFESRNDEFLLSFNAVQRNQFWVNALPLNGIGVFRDCESMLDLNCHIAIDPDTGQTSAFQNKLNPLTAELKARVIDHGQDAGRWDNIHQTFNSMIFHEPGGGPPASSSKRYWFISGGCPECVHMHWRWGRSVELRGDDYGHGSVGFYYPNTNQDMDIAIVKYKSTEQENIEPLDYAALANGESIRSGADVGDQVLVYYSATGHRQEDSFFRHLYFFNPDFGSGTKPIQKNLSSTSGNSTTATQDGPISVTFPHIYQDGNVLFTEFDPNLVGALPQGYVAYNSTAYNITTDAEVSGPYVVSFGVPSATDQTVFNSLRILHAEPDPLDPESGIWVDRTILPPDAQAPDFNSKVINSSVNNLAGFMIARLVQSQPPNTGTADLSVTTSSAPDPVVAPNNLTYTVRINNAGPNVATGVGLIDSLSSDVDFVSASATQGSCKFSDGSVYCKLGSLNSGANTTVTIVTTPNERGNRFPSDGQSILNTAFVMANETDPNKNNNSFVKSSIALPNPNAPPTVSITTPANSARYVGPANISVIANATDSDGTISQVNFYDGASLIGSGTPTGSNQYSLAWNNVTFGQHSLAAVATDNGGRKQTSSPINILVNGSATVSISSPANGIVIAPHSNVVITANASIPSGVINKVDFFANSTLLGTVNGGGQCSTNWNNVPNGKYAITAVVTDGSGITTTSMPVTVVVSATPTVSLSAPQDGATFGSMPVVTITANAQDDDSIIDKVTFYANGTQLGTGLRTGLNQFTFTWRGAPDGIFSVTAAATDQFGLTTTSSAITIGVNTLSPQPGAFVWFDDALPPGAVKHTESEDWYWVDANPGAFSGTKSHQSRNFGQVAPPNGVHKHYFDGATMTLPVNAGDRLFTYVFLDYTTLPREMMLEWKDANGWEHRAYWGQNSINLGTDGTNSRRYIGPLPKANTWVRLEVPASAVGLEGATVSGMAFTLDAGRATWDIAGKLTQSAPPPPTTPPGDSVWLEDSALPGVTQAVVDDTWNWVTNPHYSGQYAHQTFFDAGDNKKFRSHSFTGAQTPMQVNSGDVLFTYVYLGDPDLNHQPYTPDQIMLQWYDGSSWEHRAFWSNIYLGSQIPNSGVWGTEGQRYMGGLPPARSWYRLEVPASYVGLEGKAVSGMAFSVYRESKNPFVTWDRSGKAANISYRLVPDSPTTGIFRLVNSDYGYAFETNDLAAQQHSVQKANVFFAYTSQAAGTMPMYRFRRPTNYEYFYSTCRTCYQPPYWDYYGIAFYVFPDASVPGTVPLYLYHDSRTHYFLTVSQNEAASLGLTLDGIWAYVYATDPSRQQGCTAGFFKFNADKQGANAWAVPTTTLVSSVFTIPACLQSCSENYLNITLLPTLSFMGGKTLCQKTEILLRAGVAAYLNAQSTCVQYPLNAGQVVTEVNAALASCDSATMIAETTRLDGFNNLTCPISQVGQCTNPFMP